MTTTNSFEPIRLTADTISATCNALSELAWYVAEGRKLPSDKAHSEEMLQTLGKAFKELWRIDPESRQSKRFPITASEVAAIDDRTRYLKLSVSDRIRKLNTLFTVFAETAASFSGAYQPARIMDMNAVEGKDLDSPAEMTEVDSTLDAFRDELQKLTSDLTELSALGLPCSTGQQSHESCAKPHGAS